MSLAMEIFGRLVAFDTVSRKSCRTAIDWVAELLRSRGVTVEILPAPDAGKASLLARIGPPHKGGIVLSGHIDVVPVDGQDWSTDPFRLTARDGRLYGRGTADMKAFVALAAAALHDCARLSLSRPLYLALSHDEEIGCLGVPSLVHRLIQEDYSPQVAVIGEPTELRPVNGHKGCCLLRTTFEGKEVHSSAPHLGASANLDAARFIGVLERYFTARAADGACDLRFDPPVTTFNVGKMAGGRTINTIPGSAELSWDFRCLPSAKPAQVRTDIDCLWRAEAGRAGSFGAARATASTEVLADVPPLAPEPDGAAEHLVRRLTNSTRVGIVAFGTEAGFFQAAGISSVVCGPGSIEQAHHADEYISVAQFEAGQRFMADLGEMCSAP
jgi:acetylornithine deacetylase